MFCIHGLSGALAAVKSKQLRMGWDKDLRRILIEKLLVNECLEVQEVDGKVTLMLVLGKWFVSVGGV